MAGYTSDPMVVAIEELERQLTNCRKELMAVEATREHLIQQLHQAREELGDIDGCYEIAAGGFDKEYDHVALKIALEQAYIDGRHQIEDWDEPMGCGHPRWAIEYNDEGTSYCAWCESLERAREQGAIDALEFVAEAIEQGGAKRSWSTTSDIMKVYAAVDDAINK